MATRKPLTCPLSSHSSDKTSRHAVRLSGEANLRPITSSLCVFEIIMDCCDTAVRCLCSSMVPGGGLWKHHPRTVPPHERNAERTASGIPSSMFPHSALRTRPRNDYPTHFRTRTWCRGHRHPGLLSIAVAMRNVFSSVRQRNIAVGVAVCGFAAAMASIPFVVRKRMT